MSDQYIVRLVHDAADGGQHIAYHGPYPTFRGACAASDELAQKYIAEPMRLDGSPCRTECYAETLMSPPRLFCPCGKSITHLDVEEESPDWACRVPSNVRVSA